MSTPSKPKSRSSPQEMFRTSLNHSRQWCSMGAVLWTATFTQAGLHTIIPAPWKICPAWNLDTKFGRLWGKRLSPHCFLHPSAFPGLPPPGAAVHQVSWPAGRLGKGPAGRLGKGLAAPLTPQLLSPLPGACLPLKPGEWQNDILLPSPPPTH